MNRVKPRRGFLRLLIQGAGILCLISALFPLVLYRILNVGVAGLFLIGGALVLLPVLWNRGLARFPRLRRLILIAGCAGLAFCLTVSVAMARRAWFNPPPATGEITVIVLGSKIVGDQPSLMLWRRLHVAADYLERNPDAVCIVSGGQGADEEYTEAYVMKKHLVETGIDPDRITMEDRSGSTRENLRYSGALMDGGDTAVIATDSFHQLRASIYARAEGLETYNISSLTPWGLMPAYWLREIFGVSWAWLSIQLGLA